MLEMLDHIGKLIYSLYLFLTLTKAVARFMWWFPDDCPQYWKIINPLIERYLNISRSVPSFFVLSTYNPHQAPEQPVSSCWEVGVGSEVSRERGSAYGSVVLGLRMRIIGCLGQTSSEYTGVNRGPLWRGTDWGGDFRMKTIPWLDWVQAGCS